MRLSKKEYEDNFICKASKVHNNKYNYSKVVYTNNRTKVIINCPTHGDFKQKVQSHLIGQGCPLCFSETRGKSNFKTTEQFIEQSKTIYGKDRFDYSKTVYTGFNNKVTITCKKHGDFLVTPGSHHYSNVACPKCSSEKLRKTTDQFIKDSMLVHGSRYTYSKTEYVDSKTHLTITCKVHGDFLTTPSRHLDGTNCGKCSAITRGRSLRMTFKEFLLQANKLHNSLYDYSKTIYTNYTTKIKIICHEHGEFEQTPAIHLRGSGCPACANYGFDQTKPAYLYYLKITTEDNQTLYKIGITNKSVNERFNLTDLNKIEIIKQKDFLVGADAYKEEQRILKDFKDYKYLGPDILQSGNTELFTKNILNL